MTIKEIEKALSNGQESFDARDAADVVVYLAHKAEIDRLCDKVLQIKSDALSSDERAYCDGYAAGMRVVMEGAILQLFPYSRLQQQIAKRAGTL